MTYIDLFWRAEQFPHSFKIIQPIENRSNEILGSTFTIFPYFETDVWLEEFQRKNTLNEDKIQWKSQYKHMKVDTFKE